MYQQHWSKMYETQWESYMGRISNVVKVVGSEQMGYDPMQSPNNNIVTNQTQHEGNFGEVTIAKIKSPVIFEDEQQQYYYYDEIENCGWSCLDEFPKITDPPLLSGHASGGNFTTNVDGSLLSNSVDQSNTNNCSEEEYSNNMSFYHHFPQIHDPFRMNDDSIDEKPLQISFQITNKSQKQSPQLYGNIDHCVTSSNSASIKFQKCKRRVRWTEDLHESFMMIVNQLGGPEKAKPKAILDMMKSNLLSISHVKSHLQKCRSTIRVNRAQEKSEEGHKTNRITELQLKILMQIEESRQLQLEVGKSISQQLEMQRNMQTLIKQQRKKLKLMLDFCQKKKNLYHSTRGYRGTISK